jgi:hypothetical protein
MGVYLEARDIPEDADRRIAIDANELHFRVIVEDGIAYDERAWIFSMLDHGVPADQLRYVE